MDQPQQSVTIDDFEKIKLLGSGSCGDVYLVKNHNNNLQYAMKIIAKNSQHLINKALTEKEILVHLHHPFITELFYSFQTSSEFYIIMSYCEYGDFYHFMRKQKQRCFNEEQTKYYASCILLALEYLHLNGIIYRDLKPENILVTKSGHIKLTDFDLSVYEKENITTRTMRNHHSHDLHVVCEPTIIMCEKVGTPEYFAPEIVDEKPYTCQVDWWAFGIFIYEMLYGYTPFVANSIQSIQNLIKKCHLEFSTHTPQGLKLSTKVKKLIKKLLKYEPHKRLGFKGGAIEIKDHPFFDGVEFQLLRSQIPPIVPDPHVPMKRKKSYSC